MSKFCICLKLSLFSSLFWLHLHFSRLNNQWTTRQHIKEVTRGYFYLQCVVLTQATSYISWVQNRSGLNWLSVAFSLCPSSWSHFSGSPQLRCILSLLALWEVWSQQTIPWPQLPWNAPHKPWLLGNFPDTLSEYFDKWVYTNCGNRCWRAYYSPF